MARPSRIIDCDTHFVEARSTWLDHIEPAFRDRALHIADDERGFPWPMYGNCPIELASVHTPGRVDLMGESLRREREWDGAPPAPFEELVPPEQSDPRARLAKMDAWGVDAAIFFPNYGLLWEDALRDDVPATCANMAAYNAWVTEIAAAAPERLFGVCHLTLRDLNWAEREIADMASAGIKLAMIAPSPVDGKSLAHPDLDRVWACFQDCDVAPVFHVSAFRRALDPAWYALDPSPVNKLLDNVFLYVAPAAAISSLIIHGKLEQFPRLRLGVIELSARWVPEYLLHLDGGWNFYATQQGRALCKLPLRPSEYFRRQVRVAAFALEGPTDLIARVGTETFMWCSDYPHAEGLPEPLADYERIAGELPDSAAERLYFRNAAWLLGQEG